MDQLSSATEQDALRMPDWIYTFHQWMLTTGRKDGTCKTYANTLRLLFDEDSKAIPVLASEVYWVITKASFKNKSGNGQRAASAKLFGEFFRQHGDTPLETAPEGVRMYQVGKLVVGTKDAKLDLDQQSEEAKKLRVALALPSEGWKCGIRKRASGDLISAISPGGTAYNDREAVDERLGRTPGSSSTAPVPPSEPAPSRREKASTAKSAEASQSGTSAPKAKAKASAKERAVKAPAPTPVEEKIEEGTLVRKAVSLEEAFRLLNGSGGTSKDGRIARKPSLLVAGRDPSARLTNRLHGLYVQQDEQHDGHSLFVKADREKSTVLSFSEEKGAWRFSADIEAKGDFAKVKDRSLLPWKVAKLWRVFSGTAYDEDPALKVTFLSPNEPLPSQEVEVCLPYIRPPVMDAGEEDPPEPERKEKRIKVVHEEKADQIEPKGSLGSSRRTVPIADALQLLLSGDVVTGGREMVLVSGLEEATKNASRMRGIYLREDKVQRDGRAIFKKMDEVKPAFLWFAAEKEKWVIAKDLDAKGTYAHAKDKASLPWDVKKPWKVFDGENYVEATSLRLIQLDPANPPAGVEVEISVGGKEDNGEKREKREKKEKKERRDSRRAISGGNDNFEKLPPAASAVLPEDAPPGHEAHAHVRFDRSFSRALFKFDGVNFQATKKGAADSQYAAEVIARACYVKFAAGRPKEEVVDFRQQCFSRLRAAFEATGQEERPAKRPKPDRDAKQSKDLLDGAEESSQTTSFSQTKSAKTLEIQSQDDGKSPRVKEEPSVSQEAPGIKAEKSEHSSSSSSSSSSAGESDNEEAAPVKVPAAAAVPRDSVATAAMAGPQGPGPGRCDESQPPKRLGRVAAKMSVRTGLRCYRCYDLPSACRCPSDGAMPMGSRWKATAAAVR
ncbi:unnamed protein product [Polarella glacialis]|uniref:Uncharacterized protein n=2 Tax=Polarella glacialis TaxID=89957 RepID=A0A813HQV5_POLGL|nr:unnamed protein product [Polarella glacialis]